MSAKTSVVDPPAPDARPATSPSDAVLSPFTVTVVSAGAALRSSVFPVAWPLKLTPPAGPATKVVEPDAEPTREVVSAKTSVVDPPAPDARPATSPSDAVLSPFTVTVVSAGAALRSSVFPVAWPLKLTRPAGPATQEVEPDAEPTREVESAKTSVVDPPAPDARPATSPSDAVLPPFTVTGGSAGAALRSSVFPVAWPLKLT